MDMRKTGWAVRVSYWGADHTVKWGVAEFGGKKGEAVKRFKRFIGDDVTVELMQHGRTKLRSVNGLETAEL